MVGKRTHSKVGSTSEGHQGFSLVELLVAMALMGVLMAGMLRIFASHMQNLSMSNELIGAQRSNRWALGQLSDDFQSAGNFFPVRDVVSYVMTGTELPFAILPNKTLTVTNNTGLGTASQTLSSANGYQLDEVQFLLDLPSDFTATVGTAITGINQSGVLATSVQVNFPGSTRTQVKAGDFVMFLDSNWEMAMLSADPAADGTLSFETDPAKAAGVSTGLSYPHAVGAEVVFIRPYQLVKYSVEAIALDPSDTTVTIPCLVRRQTSYPTSGTVTWSSVSRTIIAENVEGFKVDLSMDGGANWARAANTTSNDTWANVATVAEGQIPTGSQVKKLTDPSVPLWYRYLPATIRIDLTTRTARQRTEYAAARGLSAATAFGTRRQTLFFSPRNFGYGL